MSYYLLTYTVQILISGEKSNFEDFPEPLYGKPLVFLCFSKFAGFYLSAALRVFPMFYILADLSTTNHLACL